MKIKEFNEPIQPDTGTAQNQLLKIGQHAIKIENMIANSQEVSDWSSNKINLASDYVKKVHGYMQGEKAGLYDDGGLTEDANDQEKIKGLLQWFQNKHDTYRKDFIDDQIENGIKGSQLEQAVENNDELWELENIVNELKSGSMENAIEAINQAKYEFSGIPGEDDNFMQVIEKLGIPKDTFYFTKDESVSEDAGTSPLKETARMAIELIEILKNGGSIDESAQNILNQAADNLHGAYNYESYAKTNPYREELDSNTLSKHAQVIQKHIDEILARETSLDDIDTKPGMMRILNKRVNEVEKELAKENRKEVEEGGMPASIIKHKQKLAHMSDEELANRFKDFDEQRLRQMAWRHGYGKMSSHYLDRVRNHMTSKRTGTTEAELEEGLKDWAKRLAAAGIIVGTLAGIGTINNAIDNSVPTVKALNTAYELAVDQGHTELAKNIEDDLSAVKIRLQSGKDLNFVKNMQNKYSKFVDAGGLPYSIDTEDMAYESKLAIMLNQQT